MYEVEKVSNGWILRVYEMFEGQWHWSCTYICIDTKQVFAKMHELMEGLK